MKRRKKNLYFGFGPSKPTKRERRKSRTEFQAGVKRKRAGYKKVREKESSTLFHQLQRDAKPQRARRYKLTPADEEAWKEMLRSNPRQFPGNLTKEQVLALRKLVRQKTMATKKRKRKKNSRKGKMPAGLKAYWAKKRRAKAKRKNPKKRRARARKPRKRVRVARPFIGPDGKVWYSGKKANPRVRRYRKTRKRRKANPRRKRSVKIIKTNLRKGTKAFNQFVAQTRAKYGTARVL